MRHGLAGGVLGDLLRGVGRALAGAFETDATGAGPSDDIAMHIGDADQGVVESGQDVGNAVDNVLGVLGFDDLLGIGVLAQKFGGGGRGNRRGGRGGLRGSGRGAFGGLFLLLRLGGLLFRFFYFLSFFQLWGLYQPWVLLPVYFFVLQT